MNTQVTSSIFADRIALLNKHVQPRQEEQTRLGIVFLANEKGKVLHEQKVTFTDERQSIPELLRNIYWCNGSFGLYHDQGDDKEFEFIHYLNDQLSFQLGLSIFQDLKQKERSSSEYLETMVSSLGIYLVKLIWSYKPHQKGHKVGMTPFQIRKISNFVQENIENRICLQDMANLVKLSPFHFSRMFKQATGLTPYQFVIRCRLNKSVHQIINSRIPISHIAYEVGYESAGNFSRSFKRQFDITPTDLRRMSDSDDNY